MTFWVFVIMGVLAALAGIVFAARLNLANPTNGNAFELDAIAAAFIGGAAVTGGVGRDRRHRRRPTMAVLNNGMSIMGVDVAYQQVIKGGAARRRRLRRLQQAQGPRLTPTRSAGRRG